MTGKHVIKNICEEVMALYGGLRSKPITDMAIKDNILQFGESKGYTKRH